MATIIPAGSNTAVETHIEKVLLADRMTTALAHAAKKINKGYEARAAVIVMDIFQVGVLPRAVADAVDSASIP